MVNLFLWHRDLPSVFKHVQVARTKLLLYFYFSPHLNNKTYQEFFTFIDSISTIPFLSSVHRYWVIITNFVESNNYKINGCGKGWCFVSMFFFLFDFCHYSLIFSINSNMKHSFPFLFSLLLRCHLHHVSLLLLRSFPLCLLCRVTLILCTVIECSLLCPLPCHAM